MASWTEAFADPDRRLVRSRPITRPPPAPPEKTHPLVRAARIAFGLVATYATAAALAFVLVRAGTSTATQPFGR